MNDNVRQVLLRPAVEAAPLLLGMGLYVDGIGGRIVETEAYHQHDLASHSFGGPRGRNIPMFKQGGCIYVYRSYGIHWCLNIVTGSEGHGEAVLIRALSPTRGIAQMQERRPGIAEARLCSGPGNVAKALAITGEMTGMRIGKRIRLVPGSAETYAIGPRIGISKAVDEPYRFWIPHHPSVSRKRGMAESKAKPV